MPVKAIDPFYESQENHNLIGVANIFLEVLFHDVRLDYHTPIISQQGEVAGRLQVSWFFYFVLILFTGNITIIVIIQVIKVNCFNFYFILFMVPTSGTITGRFYSQREYLIFIQRVI